MGFTLFLRFLSFLFFLSFFFSFFCLGNPELELPNYIRNTLTTKCCDNELGVNADMVLLRTSQCFTGWSNQLLITSNNNNHHRFKRKPNLQPALYSLISLMKISSVVNNYYISTTLQNFAELAILVISMVNLLSIFYQQPWRIYC